MVFLRSQPDEAATMQTLREYFALGSSRTYRTCLALAREGLVHASPLPEDQRHTVVRLTAKGHRIIDDALAALRGKNR